MKIAVVGGGSTYTPELIEGFARRAGVLAVDELVLHDISADRLDVVGGLARRILANGPLAIALCIEAVDSGLEMSLEEGLVLEANHFGLLAVTEDMTEGMKAFLEKRTPVFGGK